MPSRAHSAALGAASWSRFSPTSVTPSSRSRPMSDAGRVLVIAMIVISLTFRPASSQAAATRARTRASPAAISSRRASARADAGGWFIRPSWREPDQAREPPSTAVAPVGVEIPVLGGAPVVDPHLTHPGRGQLSGYPGAQVEARGAGPGQAARARNHRRDGISHLLRYLVTAPADGRADDRARPGRIGPRPGHRAHQRRDD